MHSSVICHFSGHHPYFGVSSLRPYPMREGAAQAIMLLPSLCSGQCQCHCRKLAVSRRRQLSALLGIIKYFSSRKSRDYILEKRERFY